MDDLIMWIVYDHPADYPASFVARKDSARFGQTQERLFSNTLEGIRKAVQDAMPYELVRMDRHPDDDPVIMEIWL